MNGLWPIYRGARGRTARACVSALLLAGLTSGCARGVASSMPTDASRASTSELAALRGQLAEREQTIQQLEGRNAMLEASERQLREQLVSVRAQASEEAQARETVRIGARKQPQTQASAPEPSHEPRIVLTSQSEPRPMLRLSGERERREVERPELTSTWTAPETTERLTVMQLPRLPAHGERREAAAVQPEPAAPLALNKVATSDGPASELYVRALDLLRRRELPEALRELDAFLRAHPGDSRASRAQYWRGEILLSQQDFARALAAYEASLVRDPAGDKAPDTLLRIARCQSRLGAHERARAALNKLRTQFPESEAARIASQVKQEDT